MFLDHAQLKLKLPTGTESVYFPAWAEGWVSEGTKTNLTSTKIESSTGTNLVKIVSQIKIQKYPTNHNWIFWFVLAMSLSMHNWPSYRCIK